MSSKKARRRKRKEQTREQSRWRLSPVTLFMLAIGLALALTVAGTFVFSEREEPPWPGAVWSAEHGHWH